LNGWDSLTVNGVELFGTLTNGTRTMGGSMTNVQGVLHGKFQMSRTGFVPIHLPPTITSAPQNKSIPYGGNVIFTVSATGTPPLYYQWYSAASLADAFTPISGATDTSLAITNIRPTSDTVYSVVVQNYVGQTNVQAILTAIPEFVAPTLSILSPVAGQRVSNDVFTISGVAGDNVRLDGAYYSLNGSAATLAEGTSNWSASVNLIAGTNVFRAYAVDSSNNHSRTGKVSVFYFVPSPLTLITNGLGGISRNFNAGFLEVGRNYTVTAVPGAGQVFSNWLAHGNVVAQTATYSFLMQASLVLQANFIPNPFLAAQGSYAGLFAETPRAQARSGSMSLTLGDHGAYTGAFKCGTNSYGFSGKFDVSGHDSRSVMIGGTTGTITMTLDLAGAQTITGTVGTPSWTADLLACRAAFAAATNPATQFRGRYNLILPGNDDASVGPGGDGYATVRVTPGGNATVAGWLADNQAIGQSMSLSGAGQCALYAPLYGGSGSVWGWLQFDTNNPAAHVDGNVNWIRPAIPGTKYYPSGFTNEVAAGGSRYVAPTNANTRIIGLTNGIVFFSGGNLSAPFTNQVTLSSGNQVISTKANKLSMNFTVSNGVFSGSVKVPGAARTNNFKGALLQDVSAGYGFFLETNQSGAVFFGEP
jgi:hypothetical protein